jgi:glutamate N-acetyltransferase/amino-acid N-acetyltransferase
MNHVQGGVCAPIGFKAAGVRAGIKPTSTAKDCALVLSEVPATVAGTFTTNLMKAPPIHWTEDICANGTARAIFLNSDNANACTGEQGEKDAAHTAALLAEGIGATQDTICVLSTGVIGVPLPMDKIAVGVEQCIAALAKDGGNDAACAIMTTDTVPKETAVAIDIGDTTVTLGAMAKGAGMISPNMATMFGIVTTDAAIAAEVLKPLLKKCVDRSFNQIAVDNDMSTSDAIVCLANGQSGAPSLAPGTESYDVFATALEHVCIEMAKALVRDGEGATKFIEINVAGVQSDEDAKTIARTIAHSQLCKTAFFGEDPNWGRIACAAGYAGVPFDPNDITIAIGDVLVTKGGVPTDFKEEDAAALMQKPEVQIHLSVGDGPGNATFWTSDLSHAYITINADYRT